LFGWIVNRPGPLASRKVLGKWGERRCEKFLRKGGFKILARNFSCKTGEIDLVAADTDGSIVFVEVKTRADEKFAAAESSITPAKKKKLTRTARYFLSSGNIEDRPYRFDVVTIILPPAGRERIIHYKNAFVP